MYFHYRADKSVNEIFHSIPMKDRASEGNLPWRSDERVINNIQQPENPWVFHPAEWTRCPAKRRAAPCPVTKTVNFYWSEPVRSLSFSINYSANTQATLILRLKDSIPGPTVMAKQMYFYIKSTTYCCVCWFPPPRPAICSLISSLCHASTTRNLSFFKTDKYLTLCGVTCTWEGEPNWRVKLNLYPQLWRCDTRAGPCEVPSQALSTTDSLFLLPGGSDLAQLTPLPVDNIQDMRKFGLVLPLPNVSLPSRKVLFFGFCVAPEVTGISKHLT